MRIVSLLTQLRRAVRTPLNAVQGAAMLLQDTAPLSQEQRELLSVLDAGAAHVVVIVEDSACMLRAQACLPCEESDTRDVRLQSCCTAR